MRTIITVTEYPSMPGRYKVFSGSRADRRGIVRPRDVQGEHAAAAVAMEYAVDLGGKGYAVFAPRKVLELIPQDMRQRNEA